MRAARKWNARAHNEDVMQLKKQKQKANSYGKKLNSCRGMCALALFLRDSLLFNYCM